MKQEEFLEIDKNHIWHPYTSVTEPLPCFLVEKAEGVYIELTNGKRLIDGMSSWWCAIHGYNNEVLNKAVNQQISKMSHVMFGGLTHEPAISLAKKLIEITPSDLQKVFFSDSGSVAVEVAMKMAIQYWYALQKPKKNKFLTILKGYHGDTWHTMSVCDPETGMHNIFSKQLPQQYFVKSPTSTFNGNWNEEDLTEIKNILQTENQNIAAFILEPIVQGAGGMRFYNSQFLIEIKKLCAEYEILLICDEIATGFGRTGKLFACNHANITPDIMCLGKAITGGYISFAATLCTNKVAETISNNSPKVFMHGPTFMGNPLACAVANASIDLLFSYDWQTKISEIEKQLASELLELKNNSKVQDVRVLGAIGVVEMKENVNMAKLQQQFVNQNVWIRPFNKLIYLMPPYIINQNQITQLTNAIKFVIKN